jgi:hypothetical protein
VVILIPPHISYFRAREDRKIRELIVVEPGTNFSILSQPASEIERERELD